jgi:hypothetical protein
MIEHLKNDVIVTTQRDREADLLHTLVVMSGPQTATEIRSWLIIWRDGDDTGIPNDDHLDEWMATYMASIAIRNQGLRQLRPGEWAQSPRASEPEQPAWDAIGKIAIRQAQSELD